MIQEDKFKVIHTEEKGITKMNLKRPTAPLIITEPAMHAKVVSAFAKYGFLEAHKQHPIPERPQPAAAAATDSREQAGQ